MNRKLLSLLLSSLLIISSVPTSAFAVDEGYIAEVWTNNEMSGASQKYNNLQAAFEAAGVDGYVLMLQDCDIPLSVRYNDAITGAYFACKTFDLGGNELTVTWPQDQEVAEDTVYSALCVYSDNIDTDAEAGVIKNGKITISGSDNLEGKFPYFASIYCTNRLKMRYENLELAKTENAPMTHGVIFSFASTLGDGDSSDHTFKNCVVKLGENVPTAYSFLKELIEDWPEEIATVTGNFECLNAANSDNMLFKYDESQKKEIEGIGIVITSDETTAMIVENGNAYLYDTLQEAVNAAENGKGGTEETPATITLLKNTEESVRISDNANFKIQQSEDAKFNGTLTTESGLVGEVDADGNITTKPATIPVAKITLNETSISLREGRTATLTATVEPENATNKTVTWTSSDTSVATVDQDGVVTAVSKGTAIITAKIGNVSADCEVTVTRKSSSGGSSTSTTYTVSTEDADNGTVKVSPSKAEKGDTVTITVTPDKGYEVDEVIVTDKNGKELSVKDKGNGKYTFTMPASKVSIEVTFAPERERTIILTIGSVEASVFGTPVINDVAPIARNNRTMLPIRFVAEALGARVDWDAASQKVTITRDTLVIEIFLNSDVAYVNGQPVQLDSPAFAENNRTYLPLRFVAENLGATVEWEQATQRVIITAN